MENCAALFMHGNLTHAGYQAISNILSGMWSHVDGKFLQLMAPDGKTPVPRLASLHVLLQYFNECAAELGMESVHEGQGGVLNIEMILKSQVEHLLKDALDEHIPVFIPTLLAADSAGWSKKPTHKVMKNFTAMVVRPVLDKVSTGNTLRVGDTTNSCHNNRLAALYAGSDSHHLISRFMNTSVTSDGKPVESLREQNTRLEERRLQTRMGVIGIVWSLGGDLKFLVYCMGLSGSAATHPCHQCTIHKDQLWKLRDEFPFGEIPEYRTYKWMLMMSHAFGEEVGITEPYQCPACGCEISEEHRHAPATAEEARQHALAHYSHKYGAIPVMPNLDAEDAVPDCLHGFIRSVVNQFFVCISMNLHSHEDAAKLAKRMEEDFHVERAPVHSQRNREATKKDLQSWNGKECWRVLANIGLIVEDVFEGRGDATQAQRSLQLGYDRVTAVFNDFVELMAAWICWTCQGNSGSMWHR